MYSHPIGELSKGAVLDVGLKCTHSCKFCYYSHLDQSEDQFRGMRRASFRSLGECKEILRRLKAAGFLNFDYTGGEPSLHPDIVEITRYAHRDLGLAGRMITLGQFLMRKMPGCRTERLVDDLLEAGLVNFLLSIHAVDEDLFHRITGESFARLRAAMEHLDERGFQYCSNTTVVEWNHRHLPEIARELTRHRVYLHNFIIMNAYYEWNREGRAFGVQARYSEILPHLREAVEILESSGIAVNVRYAPLCGVRGLEKNLVGMVGVRYDPYEWMNEAGHLGGSPEQCARPLPLRKGDIDAAIAYRPADLELANGVHVIGMRGLKRKLFAQACAGCHARAVCDGIDPNYLAQHGQNELRPYGPGDWTAPVHGARRRYPVPFLVKTEPGEDMLAITAPLLLELRRAATAGAAPPAATDAPRAEIASLALAAPDGPASPSEPAPPAAPRVSVVIPCYNYGRYLADAVSSVLCQTFRDCEIIVVDDGSTDETPQVAERLLDVYAGRGLRVIRQERSGQPAIARNRGIAEARGEYVLCLDADDLIAPTMLEQCVALLDGAPGVAIAYTDRRDFDGVDQIVQAAEYDFARLRHENHLSYCALFRRAVWEAVGGYRTNVKGCEDWDFWVAAGARGFHGRRIPEALFCYRRHDTGLFQEVLHGFAALAAQVTLNNREVYEPASIAAAERLLAAGQAGGPATAIPAIRAAAASVPTDAASVLAPGAPGAAQSAPSPATPGAGAGALRAQQGPTASLPPLVSVILPTRNRPERLARAIESVLRQTHENLEVVVVNDGGAPVESVIESFAESGKITYLRLGVNRERSAARNAALRVARGEYVAYLDDDDWYEADHLATLVDCLETSGAQVAYSDALRATETRDGDRYVTRSLDRPYSSGFRRDALLVGNYIPLPCLMHRRSCLDEVGAFDERLETHEDWDLLIRLASRWDFVHAPRATCVFTWRDDGTSTTSERLAEFPETTALIHARYAAQAAALPQVREAQAAHRADFARQALERSFACSIVIPLPEQAHALHRCLVGVATTTPGVSYEVIAVVHRDAAEVRALLGTLGGDLIVLDAEDTDGWASACNRGASAARGDHLVFLDPGAVPKEGWLRALLDELAAHPEVDVVGAKLLAPEGTIRSAGLVFSREASGPRPAHLGGPSSTPAANRRRELQAVGADCLLVRRRAFAAAGRFPEAEPAERAAVELCLEVRQRGGRIAYQPRCVLYSLATRAADPPALSARGTASRVVAEPARAGRSSSRSSAASEPPAGWGVRWIDDADLLLLEEGLVTTTCTSPLSSSSPDSGAPSGAELRAWECVAQVQRRWLEGGLDAVRDLLPEADRWPADASALDWAARLATAAGSHRLALELRDRAVSLDGSVPRHLALARQALELGELDRATASIDAVLARVPEHAEAWLMKGVLEVQRLEYGQAATAFEAASRCGADPRRAGLGRGMAALGRGDAENAWQVFSQLVAERPDDADALHWLLRAGCSLERWRDLTPALSRYLDRRPDDAAVRFALAGVHVRLSHWAAACAEYETLRRTAPRLAGLDELAQRLTAARGAGVPEVARG